MLDFKDFASLSSVKDFIKGANVAIVGNSTSILEQKFGKEIDKNDVVIRFNKGFPLANSEALGKRTDIVFLATTLSNFELKLFEGACLIKRSSLCGNACHYAVSGYDRKFLKQGTAQASTGFIAINFCLTAGAKKITLYGFDFFKNPTYYNPKDYKTLHNGIKEAEKVKEFEKYGLVNIK